ncbi:MAG: hypothetical protein Q8P68_04730 [Candidatus Peregrinibacteria bacterium]|nr:hypothetical protein [Candidatus Peregrinibacteria bacterium]
MDQIEKFLRKIEKKLALQLMEILRDIVALKLAEYDVQKMKGVENHYRIRVGKIRIIFLKTSKNGIPIYMEYRGKVYKGL